MRGLATVGETQTWLRRTGREAGKRAHAVIAPLAEVRYGADYRVSWLISIEVSDNVEVCLSNVGVCRIAEVVYYVIINQTRKDKSK